MVTRALVLAAALALLAAACGGSSQRGSVDRPVAERLAAESDAVAAKLRAGDGCGAAALARALRHDVAAAGLPLPVQNATAGLASEIACVRPAPVQQPPAPAAAPHPAAKARDKGHEKRKRPDDHPKHGKHGKHDGDRGD